MEHISDYAFNIKVANLKHALKFYDGYLSPKPVFVNVNKRISIIDSHGNITYFGCKHRLKISLGFYELEIDIKQDIKDYFFKICVYFQNKDIKSCDANFEKNLKSEKVKRKIIDVIYMSECGGKELVDMINKLNKKYHPNIKKIEISSKNKKSIVVT